MELHANEVFDIYRGLYYGKSSSVSSVYLWDKDEDQTTIKDGKGFAGCFLIQNQIDDVNYWNSIHVVDVGAVQKGGKCQYTLTTTLLISVAPPSEGHESSNNIVTGSLTRYNKRECNIEEDSSSSHIINIGKFIEDIESDMRSELDSLYIQKTKTVVDMIRNDSGGNNKVTQGKEHTRVLNEAVLAMAMNKKVNLGGAK